MNVSSTGQMMDASANNNEATAAATEDAQAALIAERDGAEEEPQESDCA